MAELTPIASVKNIQSSNDKKRNTADRVQLMISVSGRRCGLNEMRHRKNVPLDLSEGNVLAREHSKEDCCLLKGSNSVRGPHRDSVEEGMNENRRESAERDIDRTAKRRKGVVDQICVRIGDNASGKLPFLTRKGSLGGEAN